MANFLDPVFLDPVEQPILSSSIFESDSLYSQHPVLLAQDDATAGRTFAPTILFVCLGNVCRSPVAQSILSKLAIRSGIDDDLHIDSAGIGLGRASPKASFSMRWSAFRRGYRLKKRSRRIRRPELVQSDFVIAMDRNNLADLRSLHSNPTASIVLFSEFVSDEWPIDVPDPMNRTISFCNDVIDMIEEGCSNFLEDFFGV